VAYVTADLIQEALAELEVLDASNTVASEDSFKVNYRLNGIVSDLITRRLVPSINFAAIPDQIFPALVTITAQRCADLYGKALDQRRLDEAENRLREITRLDRTVSTPLIRGVLQQLAVWGGTTGAIDVTAVSDSLPGILASLSTRNVIYIADVSTIPDAALPALTRLVAAWLAPKPMGDTIMQAERELRTVQRIGKGTGARLRVDRALLAPRRFH
jgi:hypothetical protein